MSLVQLTIANVRCIEHAELGIPSGLTLISGGNGAGKTSLLEAIFLLGRGRSFRTRNNERLIRRGQDQLTVIGRVDANALPPQPIRVQVTRDGTTARIAARPVNSLVELSRIFPVQVIEPGVHRLVEEGGFRRRRWMDWAVFHVEPRYADNWLRYTRALRQRNAALKSDPATVRIWDSELAQLGELIAESRQRMIEQLEPYWHETVAALSGLPVELNYLRGWSQEQSLLEALLASSVRDQTRQVTHVGPHRADVGLRLQGRPAREILSRGQQKLIAVALTLAQLRLLQARTELIPTLLLDDPAAELDAVSLERFIAQVAVLRCQLVVTSLHAESRLFGAPECVFRMDQGRVLPV